MDTEICKEKRLSICSSPLFLPPPLLDFGFDCDFDSKLEFEFDFDFAAA